MSADSPTGARAFGAIAGKTAKSYDGSYQFPALGTTEQEVDLSAWKGEHVWIACKPANAADLMYYAFFAAADSAKTLDTTTVSATSSTKVPTAPQWLDNAFQRLRLRVPVDRPILVAKMSANTGRLVVSHAE